jgi:hypothetical protein
MERANMGLREQLSKDLAQAMRDRDERRKSAIRSVIAAMQTAEAELDASGQRIHLDEQGIVGVIAKQAKMRQESIIEFRRGQREDLVAEEEAELAILRTYLPTQMTRAEIEGEVRRVIDEVGASDPRDIGKVMKPLMAALRGRADGRLINEVVRKILGG